MVGAVAAIALAGVQPPPPVAPYSLDPLPRNKVVVPMYFPLVGACEWRNSYNSIRGDYRHTGQDIRAPKMTPIVAPFSGKIGFKVQSFWIYGDNGYRCLGTHLNDDTPGTSDNQGGIDTMFAPNLRQGSHVIGGQLIGYVGDSGNATGPHLHFELYNSAGIFNPYYSLKAAQRLSAPRLKVDEPGDVPAPGQERWDVVWRAVDSGSSMVKVMVVSRQLPGKSVRVEARPTVAWIKVPPTAQSDGAGLDELALYPQDVPFRIYVKRMDRFPEAERFQLSKDASKVSEPGQASLDLFGV